MNNTKTIFILLIVITWFILTITSNYPNNKYKNIETPIEENYLYY